MASGEADVYLMPLTARSYWSDLEVRAAPFDEDDVAPGAVLLADAFAGADHAEPGPLMQREAGGVLRKDARLHRPDAGLFGRVDQRVE